MHKITRERRMQQRGAKSGRYGIYGSLGELSREPYGANKSQFWYQQLYAGPTLYVVAINLSSCQEVPGDQICEQGHTDMCQWVRSLSQVPIYDFPPADVNQDQVSLSICNVTCHRGPTNFLSSKYFHNIYIHSFSNSSAEHCSQETFLNHFTGNYVRTEKDKINMCVVLLRYCCCC